MHCSGAPPNLMSPVWIKNSLDKIWPFTIENYVLNVLLKKKNRQNLTKILRKLYIRRHQMHTNMVLHTKPKKNVPEKNYTLEKLLCVCACGLVS